MSRRSETLAADYFEALYEADPDPWRFRSSPYEQAKYAATLAALSKPSYRRGLEVGCSIGVLSRLLAARCASLVSIDGSATALQAARETCADCANIRFEQGVVPDAFPDGPFDLIMLSECLYYLSPGDLDRAVARSLSALEPGGEIILCHWLGETDYPMTGEAAAERFVSAVRERTSVHNILHNEVYRLDRLVA